MEPNEIAQVVSAIGNHDESTAAAVNPSAAALILADKTDVRRSRCLLYTSNEFLLSEFSKRYVANFWLCIF